MTLLLALDTSTYAVAVAVHDGTRVLAAGATLDARRHAEILMPSVRDVVRQAGATPAELTGIAVGVGPGPFTGLRAGIVTAATLAQVLDIPAVGVCSLDAIAHQVWDGGRGPARFVVATDARRKEVYWAEYDCAAGGPRRAGEPEVIRPANLPDAVAALPTAGRGPLLYPDLLPHGIAPLDVDAGHLAAVALHNPQQALPLRPLYLRQPDAVPQTAVKSVLP